ESPLVFARKMLRTPKPARQGAHHEKGKLRGRLGENIRSVCEWDVIAVRIGAIDIVEADCVLCDHLKVALPCFEELCVHLVAERGNQTVDPGFQFFYNQALRRWLRSSVDLDIVIAIA